MFPDRPRVYWTEEDVKMIGIWIDTVSVSVNGVIFFQAIVIDEETSNIVSVNIDHLKAEQ